MNVELGKIYHRDDAKKVARNAPLEFRINPDSDAGYAALLLGGKQGSPRREVVHGYLHKDGCLSVRNRGDISAPGEFAHFLLFKEDFPAPTTSLKVRELNRRADELIEKAEELKRQAELLEAED